MGHLRLRKIQTVVANYIRDLFRLAVDAGSTQLPAETWKRLVQLPIPLEQEKALAQQQLQFMQQQAQERQMMAQQLPPKLRGNPSQTAPAGVACTGSKPLNGEILQQIASDVGRTFTINIQTSSTIDLDTAQDKTEVAEFLNALGQMLAGLQPSWPLARLGVETVKALLVAVCQRFKFGLPVVDIIETIKPRLHPSRLRLTPRRWPKLR